MIPDIVLFAVLALLAIASALGMLFSKNAVYSALYLILNFGVIAVFYLLLNAPFIALAQVTVYAGAIMVLFLFVIMLLGAEQLGATERLPRQQIFAFILGAILLVEAAYVMFVRGGVLPDGAPVEAGFGSPEQVGEILYNQYLLPFEVVSVLLLVAMVGAIILTASRRGLFKAERETRPNLK